jgi:hypothetical protein
MQLRIDKALPIANMSNTDNVLPNLPIPYIEQELPKRAKLLHEKALPRLTKSNTLN